MIKGVKGFGELRKKLYLRVRIANKNIYEL